MKSFLYLMGANAAVCLAFAIMFGCAINAIVGLEVFFVSFLIIACFIAAIFLIAKFLESSY